MSVASYLIEFTRDVVAEKADVVPMEMALAVAKKRRNVTTMMRQ